MDMRILSADGHIDLMWIAEDLFYDHAPAALKDRGPRRVEAGRWTYKGAPLFRTAGQVPKSAVTDRMIPTGIFENQGVPGLSRPATALLRRKDQEIDGIEGDVIYGLLGL